MGMSTNMRHVIIEGADGCGKTELARHLEKAHGFAYHHTGPPPSDTESLFDYYRGVVDGRQETPTVYDRMFFGEVVYGPIFRAGSKISLFQLQKLRELFTALGGVTVLMLPTYDRLYRQLYDQKREFTVFERNEIKHHQVHIGYVTIRDQFDVVIEDFTFDCNRVLGVDVRPSCDRWRSL